MKKDKRFRPYIDKIIYTLTCKTWVKFKYSPRSHKLCGHDPERVRLKRVQQFKLWQKKHAKKKRKTKK